MLEPAFEKLIMKIEVEKSNKIKNKKSIHKF